MALLLCFQLSWLYGQWQTYSSTSFWNFKSDNKAAEGRYQLMYLSCWCPDLQSQIIPINSSILHYHSGTNDPTAPPRGPAGVPSTCVWWEQLNEALLGLRLIYSILQSNFVFRRPSEINICHHQVVLHWCFRVFMSQNVMQYKVPISICNIIFNFVLHKNIYMAFKWRI